MTLESSKTLGGVGALLMVIGPFIGVYTSVLGLIGLILVLIALKGLSDHYNEAGIFSNALYGFIMAIRRSSFRGCDCGGSRWFVIRFGYRGR